MASEAKVYKYCFFAQHDYLHLKTLIVITFKASRSQNLFSFYVDKEICRVTQFQNSKYCNILKNTSDADILPLLKKSVTHILFVQFDDVETEMSLLKENDDY